MPKTQVKYLMKSQPEIISPDTTLKDAAQKMAELDCGVLPVGTSEKLVGIITDRDIVIRALAKGKDVNTERVKSFMTSDICACYEHDTAETAADMMRANQVNRLIIKNTDGKVSGILSFGRILRRDGSMQEITQVIERTVGHKAA